MIQHQYNVLALLLCTALQRPPILTFSNAFVAYKKFWDTILMSEAMTFFRILFYSLFTIILPFINIQSSQLKQMPLNNSRIYKTQT
jgi:hypothetical protein